jgi:DNA repair protein RadC
MFNGINDAKACQVLSCFELARRLASYQEFRREVLSPKDVVEMFKGEMSFLKKEVFIGVYLNTRNCVIRKEEISVGTLDKSLVHPRDVFGPALTDGAKSLILVHNHPSGDPEPSEADVEVTKQIKKAGDLLGVSLLDHIIIGSKDYISFHDKEIV